MKLLDGVFLVFLALKLSGNIDWSWWWVSSPIWGCVVLAVIVGLMDFKS